MKKNKLLGVVLLIMLVASVTGCRRGPKDGVGFGPAVIDPDWDGSIDYIDGEGMLGDRFSYGEVIDIRFEHVLFGFDSSQVAAGEQPKLEQVAAYMRDRPDVKLIVDGHTCDVGSREYNMALGERRALAARAFLVQWGIEPGRIQTRSFGKENQLHAGSSESARRLNRRADFVMVR